MSLPPYKFVTTTSAWRACLARLEREPRLAMDLEANSLYAYREQVCLIQISIPGQDYIIDPLSDLDLSGLGVLIQNPSIEKVFHAAEYDLILLKREYGWQLNNLFDTMWAARILGFARFGLASILRDFYGVRSNKRHQKANWCRRPLSEALLAYAQTDTHYLLQLREALFAQLKENGCWEEARETFAEQTSVEPSPQEFDPEGFWSINGVHDLTGQQQAALRALNIYRDDQARRRNRPHFKVFTDQTMLELARVEPRDFEELATVPGMSKGQIRRYGRQLLRIIRDAQNVPKPVRPQRRNSRPSEVVNSRFERLHSWRKERAQARGVESDVILSRDALWALAQANPETISDLAKIGALGPWRRQTYGEEILHVLKDDS